ncbi:HRDC domain-containing protein [Dyadobacter bucti]|uniref:HRDC domain-containing protein n=1 Tax=Dyadobacter bucti TaxID=2572203 RepID=UPI001109F465|nr:HRDC domain-containing protein [Dyadobacter bucti]
MASAISVQDLVIKFLEESNQTIFLTGKAGTGKTTFLHRLKALTTKNFAVVAPTAIAAINAGGSTIHSFFQIGQGPQLPTDEELLTLRISREKMLMLIRLDLLVIDEISMVRADTLDHIDRILRQVKGSIQPFGGVQLLMIGDLFQLPPVWEKDWSILSRYYSGPFFFNSNVINEGGLITFELTKVYRQNDLAFIEILNKIREGEVTTEMLQKLNAHLISTDLYTVVSTENYVMLSTHVEKVQKINQDCLDALDGETFIYKADVSGDFFTDTFPAERELALKVGAQVMFIKNDSSGKKQYYNGRTARITSLNETSITVSFLDDGSSCDVPKETWQNVKFAISDDTQKIDETNSGTFIQFPLRLAWAITIHKSQGLTFDKVIIDVASAFASGQTYVALSRCRNLEGIRLLTEIRAENVQTSEPIREFMRQQTNTSPSISDLEIAKLNTYRNLVCDVFQMSAITFAWNLFADKLCLVLTNQEELTELDQHTKMVDADLKKLGQRFIDKEISIPRAEKLVAISKDRIKAAADFFLPKLVAAQVFIEQAFLNVAALNHEAEFYTRYNYLQSVMLCRIALLEAVSHSDSSYVIQQKGQDAVVSYRPAFKNWKPMAQVKTPEIVNPDLYEKLLAWRKDIAERKTVPAYSLFSEKTLREIAKKTPKTFSQLALIKNFGEQRANEFGHELINIVNSYLGQSAKLF